MLFDGTDVTSLSIEKRNVGMVFQSYALFPNMDVTGNIGYGLKVRKRPGAEIAARVSEMLVMMRIEPLADRNIDQLSGGQRQRVALARALAVQPSALLMDEPLTALDAKLRDSLRLEIDQLLRRLGITAIYVTHDQAEAMALGDRIVVMEHGRVAQVGRPREIYQRPATRFVAEFIGNMNRLNGSVREGAFLTDAGRIPWPDAPADATEVFFRPEDVTLAEAATHLNGSDHRRVLSRRPDSAVRARWPGQAACHGNQRAAEFPARRSREPQHRPSRPDGPLAWSRAC